MTSTSLPRRALVGAVLSASLLGTGLVAFAGDAAAGCSFTDAAGDSSLGLPGSGDDDLDLTTVGVSTNGDVLTAAMKVVALTEYGPENYPGDDFEFAFTLNKKEFLLGSYRDFNPTADTPDIAPYVYVDGDAATATSLKPVYDVKGSTFSIDISLAELEKLAGAPVAGAPLSALGGKTYANFNGPEQAADTAAPKEATTAYNVGATGCAGAGAAPVASAAPSATPAPSPAATPTATIGGADPSKPPTAGCFLAKDPKGDAHYLTEDVPNDADVDLTGFTLGSDSKNLYAYIKTDKLADGPQIHDGHRFYLNFAFNKHLFTAAGSSFKHEQAGQLKDGLAQTGQVAHVTQLAVDGVSSAIAPERFTGAGPGFVESGLKFVFDQKTSTVQVILPVADIEKYGKAPVRGGALSGVYVGSYGDAFAVAQGMDVVPDGVASQADSKLIYAFGNNACFGPPAPPLKSLGALKAQYGDTAAVAAKLVDDAGKAVAGKAVTFTLGTSKVTGKTGADGVAKAILTVKEKAGRRTLTMTSGTTKATAVFTVLVEKTVLKATGGRGNVVATLTDDDRKPVAGQLLTFTSGSKKVTARTAANGVAKAAGFPAHATVKVAYAGAAGMYSAASTTAAA